jgi:hypothetical protein
MKYMENNTMDQNKTVSNGQHVCCKNHQVVKPLAFIILLFLVFAAGLAIGHKCGNRGGFGEFNRRVGRSDCMNKGNFEEGRRINKSGYFNEKVNTQGSGNMFYFSENSTGGQPEAGCKMQIRGSEITEQKPSATPKAKK